MATFPDARVRAVAASPHFGKNWLVVKTWSEKARYYQRKCPADRGSVESRPRYLTRAT